MAEVYTVAQDAMALVAATAKTVVEISTPATRRAWIRRWWVEFDGVTAANAPVKCELARATAVVTGTTVTPNPVDPGGVAALSTVRFNASAEGTIGVILDTKRVPPTSGYEMYLDPKAYVLVPVSGFWRIRLTAAQGVNATAGIEFEE